MNLDDLKIGLDGRPERPRALRLGEDWVMGPWRRRNAMGWLGVSNIS